MATSAEAFISRVAQLKADVLEQGRRVQTVLERSFDAVFSGDVSKAREVIAADDVIDKVDVEIERASVRLLSKAAAEACELEDGSLRALLTIVKVNNELERTADAAVAIAERVAEGTLAQVALPETLRVMCNSVVGILRDVVRSMDRSDPDLARLVLQSEDAVEHFKIALLKDAEAQIAAGTMGVDVAFSLHEIANQCERMADHCTNIAEQVIYEATGTIVRHTDSGWVDIQS